MPDESPDDATVPGPKTRQVTSLTDPRALRAMAHPIRLSLVAVLRREGPLTATQAGALISESSASCSFHLRQLAKYGLVEEAGGGKGRERPWRATAMFTAWPTVADTPEAAAALGLLDTVIAERWFEALMRWLDAKPGEPAQWQHAAHFGDTMLYLTSDELAGLAEEIETITDRYLDRLENPELRPPGARQVTFLNLAFPGDIAGASQKASTGETSTGKTSTGKTSTGKTSTGKTSTGKTSTGKTSTGKTSTGKTSTGKTSTGKTSTGKPGEAGR